MEVFIEAGGTKTEVVWRNSKGLKRLLFEGIHPAAPNSFVVDALTQIKAGVGAEISSLHYYGTGVEVSSFLTLVKDTLDSLFPKCTIHIYSDLLLLVHAALKKGISSGAAAIFGTGSNYGVFSAKEFEQPFPALGFIMGDEGAGVHLGRLLIQHWSRGKLSGTTKAHLEEVLTTAKFQVSEIYGAEKPNKELASIVKRIDWNGFPELMQLVDVNFRSFFIAHQAVLVSPLICTGGLATSFSDNLKKVGNEFQCEIVVIPQCLDALLV